MVNPGEEKPIASRPGPVTAAATGADSKADRGALNGKKTGQDVPPVNGQVMKPDGEEVIPNQDLLTIKIQVPGSDAFDLQISPQELVQEIIQVLMDREDTCHRTCFSLQHRNTILDNFSELSSVEGLRDGSILKVVEEPYTAREARIHIRHVRDLLKSLDPADAYNGINCNSLSFLTLVSEGDAGGESISGSNGKRKRRSVSDQLFDAVDCSPPDYILPGTKDRLLSPLQPPVLDNKSVQCLKALMLSGWNPPPGNRRMHGDLMYLYVIIAEEKHISLTASTRGFYINQSTMDVFNPKPASPSLLCHSLAELLSHISPTFKKNFTALQRKRVQCHPLKRIATPYQLYSWSTPHTEHTIDCVRAEDAFTSRLGYEEHIPGQTRDWNEELQTTRELPREVLTQRLQRERAMFKVNSDFVAAATRGATAVIDGNVMAINPGEEAKTQMFIWNGIFFSLGFDVRDQYKDLGGDCAARAASGHDLKGVRAFGWEDTPGLCTLGTVVVDYRGYRVTAQSIIPGILEREQEQSVVYGSVDFGKTVASDHQYVDLLLKSSKELWVQKHLVLNEHDQPVLLCSSVECKGIVGNDGRCYILDLFRTFPPDLNFLPVEGEEMPEESRSWGYPRAHRHKLCSFRPELLAGFTQHKFVLFTKLVKEKMKERESIQNGAEEGDSEADGNAEKCSALMAACHAVGSVNDVVFDIRFNPNMYSPGVRFHELENEAIVVQKRLLRDAAVFLVSVQIPGFITDCLRHQVMPADGATMTEALHQRGINIRYIGHVAQLVSQSEESRRLDHIMRLLVSEVVTRAASHILDTYLQGVEMSGLSSAISHFLNCLLSSYPNPVAHLLPDELVSRRKKSKRKLRSPGAVDASWGSLTPCELWKHVNTEASECFNYALTCDGIDQAVERFGLQKVSLLREFCIKAGIQILLRDYSFDSRHKPTFTEEDILNTFPVAKHVSVRATDGERIYRSAKEKVEKGNLTLGFELLTEALNQFNNVYGAMHPDMCDALHILARLHYLKGDFPEAVNHQQKAVIMSERTRGFDHPRTAQEYIGLALYCFANSQVCVALRLLYRARYLMLTVSGEDHPAMAALDSSIGLVLQAVLECDLAFRFLQKALEINLKYFGLQSLQTALSYHLLAQVCASKAEFRTAMQHEKETYTIYRAQLGESHQQTRLSSEFLKHVTQQAVNLQRTMNEIYQNSSGVNTNLPLVQITPPSVDTMLEQLNIINGVSLLPVSDPEAERKFQLERSAERIKQLIRAEAEMTQKLKAGAGGGLTVIDRIAALRGLANGTRGLAEKQLAALGETGGEAVSEGVTGGATVSEGVTENVIVREGVTGGATVSEDASGGATLTEGLTGGVIVSEGLTTDAAVREGVTGGAAVSEGEAVSEGITGNVIVSEGVTGGDTVSEGVTGGDTVSEGVTGGDTVSEGVTGNAMVSEGLSTDAAVSAGESGHDNAV